MPDNIANGMLADAHDLVTLIVTHALSVLGAIVILIRLLAGRQDRPPGATDAGPHPPRRPDVAGIFRQPCPLCGADRHGVGGSFAIRHPDNQHRRRSRCCQPRGGSGAPRDAVTFGCRDHAADLPSLQHGTEGPDRRHAGNGKGAHPVLDRAAKR